MKFIITFSIAVFSLGAFAQQDLNRMKQEANSDIDKKMSTLRASKDCIQNAGSMEAFKACKYDMHDEMKMQKMERMEEKKEQQESEE